jgi:hypothetical protein
MTREVLTVRWAKPIRQWWCPQLRRFNDTGATKAVFVAALAARLRSLWRTSHRLGQLKVFGKNGRIQFERTYGRDPKRRKG